LKKEDPTCTIKLWLEHQQVTSTEKLQGGLPNEV